LEITGQRHIPFYRGADRPIMGDWRVPAWQGHGKDGQGNASLPEPTLQHQPLHAALALPQLFSKYPDAYLLTLGPLTNLALAALLDVSFPQKIKKGHFWIMGGSHLSMGNVTYSAEFNVHADPEAAEICLQRYQEITMVSWEQTVECDLSWDWYDRVIKPATTPVTAYLRAITAHYETLTRKPEYFRQFVMCDMVAAAALLDPSLILESKRLHGHVETGGLHSRGATVFDWYGHHGKPENVVVVMKLDKTAYATLCEKGLLR